MLTKYLRDQQMTRSPRCSYKVDKVSELILNSDGIMKTFLSTTTKILNYLAKYMAKSLLKQRHDCIL